MPEFLRQAVADTSALDPLAVLVRLIMAMVMGGAVALSYRLTRGSEGSSASFATTLVLLAILIAMVTQVIGDNVARAFSLVGALSIVRFRTVVRDTQDTAFVIFSVVTGMAIGANKPWVALIGLVIVTLAAWFMNSRWSGSGVAAPPLMLTLRVGLTPDVDGRVEPILNDNLESRRVLSIGTARQGVSISRTYEVQLRPDRPADEFIRQLNLVDGVHGVELGRRTNSED